MLHNTLRRSVEGSEATAETSPDRVGAAPTVVSLLTDFGTSDHYVGVMKAVILTAAPGVTLIDLSHEVEPGAVAQGAFTLLASYAYFPAGSVHVAVVDPGVGSARRALVAVCGGQYFVGPDNGIFSYLIEREPAARIYSVTDERFIGSLASTTFHGRDLFAPLGAALASGTSPEALGDQIDDPVRLPPLAPVPGPKGTLSGRILHIDRFGNCVTNLALADLTPGESSFRLSVGGVEVEGVRSHYAGVAAAEPFLIWGSSGFLEISVNGESAARRLGIEAGDPVDLIISS